MEALVNMAHGSPPHTTTAKTTTKLQNDYLPELSENQAARKFDNQGIKEATFSAGWWGSAD